jgi:hypothetical protein
MDFIYFCWLYIFGMCYCINMSVSKNSLPWERQKNESSQAFSAFCYYRDLHPIERSYRRVAVDLGAPESSVATWARSTDWVARTDAWDDYRDTVVRGAELRALADMREQQLEVLEIGHSLVTDQITLLAQQALDAVDNKTGERCGIIGPQELRQWIDAMIKLKALFAGEPTEIQKVNQKIENMDLSKLTVEELQQLKNIQNKAKEEV